MAVLNSSIMGGPEVIANMRGKTAQMAVGCSRGLRKAGLTLQSISQKLVPVDYGILKASAFTRYEGKGFQTVVNVGYTASYAIYVHENVEMKGKGQPRPKPHKGKYWDPAGRGQSKFLEEPMRKFQATLNQIVKDEITTATL